MRRNLPEDGGRTLGRGRLVALLILLGGAATLLLDFTGLLG